MKYSIVIRGFGSILNGLVKRSIKDKMVLKNIKKEYKAIILRAKDIGSDNIFVTSYSLGAYYLAMNRVDNLTCEENYQILEKQIAKSKMFKLFLGNAKSYLGKKGIERRKKYAAKSKLREYENDWVFDVVEKDEKFDGGIEYYECGLCKLLKDENAFSLAKYVCRLDFVMFRMIGIELTRTKTIANGNDSCDFRFNIIK